MGNILQLKYTHEEIIEKRAQVAELLLLRSSHVKSPDITTIGNPDLRLLFEIYDEVFFGNWFKECFPGTLLFSFSRRMTKSAGKTYYPRDADPTQPGNLIIEVKISIDLIFAYGAVDKTNRIGGIPAQSSLEALQLVFEHELIHVIEFIHFQNSSCKQTRFKSLAFNLFSHTESYHCLPTRQEIAREKLGLTVGERVVFPLEGKMMEGQLHAIHKRGVVMVPDNKGAYADKQGQRYTKYYVPLQILKKKGK